MKNKTDILWHQIYFFVLDNAEFCKFYFILILDRATILACQQYFILKLKKKTKKDFKKIETDYFHISSHSLSIFLRVKKICFFSFSIFHHLKCRFCFTAHNKECKFRWLMAFLDTLNFWTKIYSFSHFQTFIKFYEFC